MKRILNKTHSLFERLTILSLNIFGHPITFFVSFIIIFVWLFNKEFLNQGWRDIIRDLIMSVTFLSFFIIQKSFNRFSTSLHLKLNELLASHENADNKMLDMENKTEEELRELLKGYAELSKVGYPDE